MDYFVRLVDMPPKVRSFVRESDDGCSATIIVNSRLSYEAQLLRYRHEIDHLGNNDFEEEDVDQIEQEAHERKGENGII